MQYREFAVVGVSRHHNMGFGWLIYNELKERGFPVYAVNRLSGNYHGITYYGAVSSIPERPQAAVVVTPAENNHRLVEDLIAQGVRAIWLQPGAVSEGAVRACEERDITVVHGWCVLMFAEPVRSYHWLHRQLLSIIGRLPKLEKPGGKK